MESGQFARSREVNTLVLIMAAVMILTLMAPKMMETFQLFMISTFQQLGTLRMTPESFIGHYGHFMLTAGTLIFPVMLTVLFAGLLASGAQSGMRVSPKAIEPKFSKLNPWSGFKRIFSSQSFAKLGVSLMKFVVIFGFTYPVIKEVLNDPIFYTSTDIRHLLAFMGETIQNVALRVIAGMVVIAAADFAYQHWKNEQDSMMTKQEVKDERKNAEGDPMVKGRIRRLQYQSATKRMMQEVPQADVVVTNPTHFSVAIKYDEKGIRAPVVVAKGADELAMHIRKIATANDVPLIPSPMLARAIFYSTEVDDEIPNALFMAVAQVLAHVYQLKAHRAGKGKRPKPLKRDLPIPPEYRR